MRSQEFEPAVINPLPDGTAPAGRGRTGKEQTVLSLDAVFRGMLGTNAQTEFGNKDGKRSVMVAALDDRRGE
jgi:hypothetical protein